MWKYVKFLERFVKESNYMRNDITRNISNVSLVDTNFRTDNNHQTKILKVAVIGSPNAGKSTVINQLVQRRVFAISKKVHTTKVKARAILNHDNTQIVFLDTPGLVSSKDFEKYKLAKSFVSGGEEAAIEADLIAVIHDISNTTFRYKLDPKVLRLLHLHKDKESLLVLNKVDTLKSKQLLLDISSKLTGGKLISHHERSVDIVPQITEIDLNNIIQTQHHWEQFSDVFMVSALLGKGISQLREYLFKKSYPGNWIFPAEKFTDQDPVRIIEDAVRSKLLEHLPEEIPYKLEVELEYLDTNEEDIITSVVLINCSSARLVGLIKGIKGERIRMIRNEAEQAIADSFLTDVHLRLFIKEKPKKAERMY